MLTALGDGTLFGEFYGEGPVRVVWLHGWARTHQDFSLAAGILAERGFASLALDLPGFGASPAPESAGGAHLYASLVHGVFESLTEPVVLVGHSLGGRVATVLGAQEPARYLGLVLVGAPLLRRAPGRSPLAYRLVRALARRGLVSSRRLEAARQRYGSLDYRNSSGVMREVLVNMVVESYEAELARLSLPVHLLWGAADTEVPLDVARRAQSLLSTQSDLVVLDSVGHLVPIEAPEALVDYVAGLLT